MKNKERIAVFWFRRDLRLEDNKALFKALTSGLKVLPVFIFDIEILAEFPKNNARVEFMYQTLHQLNNELKKQNSSLLVKKGNPIEVWEKLISEFNIKEVYFNNDYEPYTISRDIKIENLCISKGVSCFKFKDHVIFDENEILKNDGKPYIVFTPYRNKWLKRLNHISLIFFHSELFVSGFLRSSFKFPTLEEIGFKKGNIELPSLNLEAINSYSICRDIPSIQTSKVSVFLRYGLISIRKLVTLASKKNTTYLNELIWREFFIQILYHFPKVINENFKSKYNFIPWRNNEEEFKLWCKGKTGYPIVDAGIQELNKTGYMHNRVRMVVASFLTKHLLIDWRWGEAFFAEKLLDFDLALNNGNWQWVAGTGCNSSPYFRVFNPTTQQQKFDSNFEYIKKWNPNYNNIPEIVEHKMARNRYLETVKNSLNYV